MPALIILGALFALLINFLVANTFSKLAMQKGHDTTVTFVLCFFLGAVGYIYAAALPDLHARPSVTPTVSAAPSSIPATTVTVTSDSINSTKPSTSDAMSDDYKEHKYNKAIKTALIFKDTFYEHSSRIKNYEDVVRTMEELAAVNYKDSATRLVEYRNYLNELKLGK